MAKVLKSFCKLVAPRRSLTAIHAKVVNEDGAAHLLDSPSVRVALVNPEV